MFRKLTALIAFSLVIVSCQKNDTDVLHEAQTCLNTSPSSEADNCVAPLASMTTPAAYKLRCSAVYIREGYGAASSLITALDSMNSNGSTGCGGNCSSTITVMNSFNFKTGDNTQLSGRQKNMATANEAMSICSLSESKGYTQVSSLFKLGTLASTTTGLTNPTPADLENALTTLLLSPTAKEDVGQIVALTYGSTCAGNQDPSESTVKYCAELSAAVESGSSFTDIGDCLLKKIKDQAYVCPP